MRESHNCLSAARRVVRGEVERRLICPDCDLGRALSVGLGEGAESFILYPYCLYVV